MRDGAMMQDSRLNTACCGANDDFPQRELLLNHAYGSRVNRVTLFILGGGKEKVGGNTFGSGIDFLHGFPRTRGASVRGSHAGNGNDFAAVAGSMAMLDRRVSVCCSGRNNMAFAGIAPGCRSGDAGGNDGSAKRSAGPRAQAGGTWLAQGRMDRGRASTLAEAAGACVQPAVVVNRPGPVPLIAWRKCRNAQVPPASGETIFEAAVP